MKVKIIKCLLVGIFIGCNMISLPVSGQISENDTISTYYYPWRVGVHAGIPLFSGDFTSFGSGKSLGCTGELRGGYYFRPYLGLELGIGYGSTRLGVREYMQDYRLSADGKVVSGNVIPGSERYGDLRVVLPHGYVRMSLDYVFTRMLRCGMHGRWEASLLPSLGVGYFAPEVQLREGGTVFSDGGHQWGVLLGGALAVRYNFSPHWNMELRSGVEWLNNGRFDGVTASVNKQNNQVWTTSVGVTWQFGRRKQAFRKRKTVLMDVTAAPIPVPATEPEEELLEEEVVEEVAPLSVEQVDEPDIPIKEPERVESPMDTIPEINEVVQPIPDTLAVFYFYPRYSMFMLDAWNNRAEWQKLREWISQADGKVTLEIYGETCGKSISLVRRRSLQVKSCLIERCHLKESDFTTINHIGGKQDRVVILKKDNM